MGGNKKQAGNVEKGKSDHLAKTFEKKELEGDSSLGRGEKERTRC